MEKITSNKELKHGEYYWLCSKAVYDNGETSDLKFVKQFINFEGCCRPHFEGNVWAFDENNQALEKYDIYGPIPKPDEYDSIKCTSFEFKCETSNGYKQTISQPGMDRTFNVLFDNKGNK